MKTTLAMLILSIAVAAQTPEATKPDIETLKKQYFEQGEKLRHIKGFTLGEGFEYNINGKPITGLPPAPTGQSSYDVCTEFLTKKHKKTDPSITACQNFMTAHDGGKSDLLSGDVKLTFDKKKLVGVEIGMMGAISGGAIPGLKAYDYDTLYQSAVEKYGKPTHESARTLQNGYGATWQSRTAMWGGGLQDGHTIMINILEMDDRTNPAAVLEVQILSDEAGQVKPKANALD